MGKFLIKKAPKGLRFDLKAGNGLIVASGDGLYASEKAALAGIATWVKNAAAAEVEDRTAPEFEKKSSPKFEVYKDDRGYYRFRLKAKNGQVLAVSEAYSRKASCLKGVASVVRNSAGAEIVKG